MTTHGYDELNRRIRSIRDPTGLAAETRLLLDGEGNVVRTTDAELRETHRRYDALDRLVETVGPEWPPCTTRCAAAAPRR